jgi:hypothetical protein
MAVIDLTGDGLHQPLNAVLARFSDRNCEDPRDKIYSLQSLTWPGSRMEVDYSKTTKQVFLDAATHTLSLLLSGRSVAHLDIALLGSRMGLELCDTFEGRMLVADVQEVVLRPHRRKFIQSLDMVAWTRDMLTDILTTGGIQYLAWQKQNSSV